MTTSSIPIAVLGAGLTGMSAAYHLGRAGVPCRTFERLPHPGGHAITLEEDGFHFDRTGHLLHLRDPAMPFHLWLRQIALDQIVDAHRRHRVAARRSVDRERPLAAAFALYGLLNKLRDLSLLLLTVQRL